MYVPEVAKDPLSLCLECEDSETDEYCSTAVLLLSTLSLSGGSCEGETTISL